MTVRLPLLAPVALVAILLSACAGQNAAVSPAASSQTAFKTVAGPVSDPFHALFRASRALGALAPGQRVSFTLILRDPTAAKRNGDLAAMYDPHSPSFRHFLSAAQYAARYGPSLLRVASIRAWLHSRGLSSTWQRGNAWLEVSGNARLVERAFHVRIRLYRAPDGSRFYASLRDPAIPAALRPEVTGAGHLSSYFHLQKYAVPVGGLAPTDLLAAYDIRPLRNQGLDGSGQTIAFFELDGYKQQDLDTFTSKYHLPPIHPIIAAGPRLSSIAGETEMDLEVAHEIAPKARLVLYNVDWDALTSAANTIPDLGARLEPLQQRMVRENPGAVLSESWGICEGDVGRQVASVFRAIYDKADLLGESPFVSAGDNGAYECLFGTSPNTTPGPSFVGVPLPAASPGVTAVGGTRLSVRGNGSWYREEVWEEPALTEGTGGGHSAYMPLPSWQRGVWNRTLNPRGLRQMPDVAADADPSSGTANYVDGNWTEGGGTSQSAPIWAGITTLINQYLQRQGLHHAGFVNPALYALAAGKPPYPPYHDITLGTNLVYPAGPGYDMASGLGTPDAWNLLRDLARYLKGGKV